MPEAHLDLPAVFRPPVAVPEAAVQDLARLVRGQVEVELLLLEARLVVGLQRGRLHQRRQHLVERQLLELHVGERGVEELAVRRGRCRGEKEKERGPVIY